MSLAPARSIAVQAVTVALLIPALAAQNFDLADAIGRRSGEARGQGVAFHYPIQRQAAQGQFIAESAVVGTSTFSPFVHGIFIPQDTGVGASTIAADASGNPIAVTIPDIGTVTSPSWASDGSPSNDLAIRINDPSRVGGNPDYVGSRFHAVLATHACLGVTFDLTQIRLDLNWAGPLRFTANAGGSCGAVSHCVVVVDSSDNPSVRFQVNGQSGSAFTPVSILLLPGDKFLSLVGGDNGDNTINCKHAYWGDPFLTPACNGQISRFGLGCATSSGTALDISALGGTCPGTTLAFGCSGQAGLSYFTCFGFSNTSWNGSTLPLDLGTIRGVSGCPLEISLDIAVGPFLTNMTGLTLPIPNNSNLLGNHLYSQCLVADPALGTSIPIATSSSVDIRF